MFVQMLFWVIPLLFLSRRDQCFRIVALEQQLEVFQRQQGGQRLQLTDADRENPFWGQDRIAGELEKLGIKVSPRSVAKYMGPRPGPPSLGWMAFLRAHGGYIWACDWLRVKTIGFKTLYVFVVLAHERRRVVHFHITEQPSDVWVAQQMVEAMPFEQGPRFLIRDGDPLYGQSFKRRTANCGVRTIQISQPQRNCYVERLMRTLRQECLRHLVILDQKHLRWVLEQFLAYYHRSRPHQGLNQETPLPQPRLLCSDGIIRCRPILGGLHHEYFRAAA